MLRAFAFVCALIVSCAFTAAQVVPADLSPGLQAYQSYQGGEIDNVNLSTGMLSLKIPLLSYPQRGGKLKLSFSLYFNSKPFVFQQFCTPSAPPTVRDPSPPVCTYIWMPRFYANGYYPATGMYVADDQDVRDANYVETIDDTPSSQSFTWEFKNWQTADGAIHPGSLVTGGLGPSGQVSLDGSGFFNGYNVGSYDSDDNYTFPTCVQYCYSVGSDGISYYPTGSIVREDSNGNQIDSTTTQNGQPALQDTLDRIIPEVPAASTSGDSTGCTGPLPTYSVAVWQVPGVNGSQATYKLCYAQISLSAPAVVSGEPLSGTGTLLQSLVLPNGRAWTFQYAGDGQGHNYGDLTQITFPTGGTISYTYSTLEGWSGTWTRWLSSRTENANDGQGSHVWTYQYVGQNTQTVTNTVTDPLQNQQVHTFTTLDNGANSPVYETETQEYAGAVSGGSILKTTIRAYQSVDAYPLYPGSVNVFPTSETVTYANGSTTQTTTQYCCSFTFSSVGSTGTTSALWGRPSDVKVYDYGQGSPGPLLQAKVTTYEAQQSSQYLTANMLDLVSDLTTNNGAGSKIADSSSIFDESAYLTSSDVTAQHGSLLLPVRGNLTTMTEWLNGGTSPQSHTNWYDTGEIYQTIDPRSNATTYTYSPTYFGALPTTVTNALGQSTTYAYDLNTGQKTSATDPNQQTTTYSYNDPLGRLTDVLYPDIYQNTNTHGETRYQYNDSASPVNFTFTKVMSPSQSLQEEVDVDGFGREWHTTLATDPAGAVYTKTTYDGLGRVSSITNPYRSESDATYGVTQYIYDALGRKTVEMPQDSSSPTFGNLTWNWNNTGNIVDYEDETGRHWQRTYDALGRLTKVLEPSGTTTIGGVPTLETDYQYDANDNLLRVDQWGGPSGSSGDRARIFTYDSLSRLLTANNPESLTTSYSYDANGNVLTKTDARGSTISYIYDALNRPVWKNSSSFSYNYLYDLNANGIGKLSFFSNDVNAAVSKTFDPMGRIATQSQCIPSDCSYSVLISAQYDVAGNLIQLTYPDGRVVHQTWDGGGHLTQVEETSFNGQNVSYSYMGSLGSFTPGYWPNGSPESLFYGNGVAEGYTLDTRLQTTQTYTVRLGADALGSYTTNSPLFMRNYLYANNSTTEDSCHQAANNGNIMQVTDLLNSNNNQTFCYDSLNRLNSFSTTGMSQNYMIDPWGNLNQVGGTLSSGLTFNQNNRITATTGYSGDAAGDVTGIPNPASPGAAIPIAYDAESKLINFNNGAATYTYNADGSRVRKDTQGAWTEYVYFNGQPLAEKNADGSWSDYIYANGQRIARADTYDIRIHMSGTNCSGCSNPNMFAGVTSLTAANGHVVQAGDVLTWRQYQHGSGIGGLLVYFTDQSSIDANDTDGQPIDADTKMDEWHVRTVDLSPYAGKTIELVDPFQATNAPAGNWDIYYGDIVLASTNGSFIPIYSRSMMTLTPATAPGVSNFSAITEKVADSTPLTTTTYYHGDQIGSTRLLTAGTGWPVSSDIYYPYGQGPMAGLNHYLFTGKERDTESGNDYFGARYYGSSMGRFLSPDYNESGDDPDPVPYADYTNPQSLNLYAYVLNNPFSATDSDGHDCDPDTSTTTTDANGNTTVTVTAGACHNDLSTLIGNRASQIAQQATQAASDFGRQVMDYLTTPRNLGCLSNSTAAGANLGAAGGAVAGLAGGPFAEVTVPSGAATGFLGGGVAGFGIGMSACMTGGSGGGGSGGGGGGSNAKAAKKLSTSRADEAARKGGYAGAEDLKRAFVGPKNGALYDLYRQPNGDIEIFRKGGLGEGIETGINIKN